jgi:FkbM family methyltransferase
MSEFFERCFEKHNFNELNNLDVNILYNSIVYYKNKYKNNPETIFDVGCNGGSFIKVLNYLNIKNNIHCFEPHPYLSDYTEQIYPFITMNKYCLTNNIGTIDVTFPMWSVGLSSIIHRPVFDRLKSEGQEFKKINVKCETIDNYCKINNITKIDFIKIDVEGAEKMVLDGANNMLQNNTIKMGIFEIGETLADAGTSEDEICKYLMNYNYKIDKNFVPNNYIFYL